MRKMKLIFLVPIIGALLILRMVSFSFLKYQILVAQRHHLLCEVLKPGMSEGEVLEELKQAGTFTKSRAEWSGGLVELGINYTDFKGRELYGGFDLFFIDYKYMRAYLKNFDYMDMICDFYQPTPSIANTRTP